MSGEPAGCFCGKIRMTVTGDADGHVLCHCLDCRKMGGSAFSNYYIVKSADVTMESGTPKEISKTADTGNQVTSHFCPDCGTTLFRTGGSFPGQHVLRAGIFDDPEWPNKHVPAAELFAQKRYAWIPPVKDAGQLEGMPSA